MILKTDARWKLANLLIILKAVVIVELLIIFFLLYIKNQLMILKVRKMCMFCVSLQTST